MLYIASKRQLSPVDQPLYLTYVATLDAMHRCVLVKQCKKYIFHLSLKSLEFFLHGKITLISCLSQNTNVRPLVIIFNLIHVLAKTKLSKVCSQNTMLLPKYYCKPIYYFQLKRMHEMCMRMRRQHLTRKCTLTLVGLFVFIRSPISSGLCKQTSVFYVTVT